MTEFLRPPSLFAAASPRAAPIAGLASLINPPPEIARLPVGAILQGVVSGRDAKGLVLLRTELGPLALATKSPVILDREVTLQIRTQGEKPQVLLLPDAVPGKTQPGGRAAVPPDPAPTRGSPPTSRVVPPSESPNLLSSGRLSSGLLTLGQTVRAVIQGPAVGRSPAQAGPAAGTPLSLRIDAVSVRAPAGTEAPAPAGFIAPPRPSTGPVAGPAPGKTSPVKPAAVSTQGQSLPSAP